MRDRDPLRAASDRRRTLVASSIVGVVGLMLGLSFASVPLYRAFCQATGFGGTTQRAQASVVPEGKRSLTVRFDANVAPGLPWSFEPETPSVTLRTGRTATVFFHVENKSDQTTVAHAIFNVTPGVVGEYFDKINCFCFTDQTLGPHEAADMPVVFFLNPALEEDESMAAVDTLSLSYTFYAPKSGAVAAASPGKAPL